METCVGAEASLARLISASDAVKPHCAHLIANRQTNLMKVLEHDAWVSELPRVA